MATNWKSNIGSSTAAVSVLHEYAVALLWDAIDEAISTGGEALVRTADGVVSNNIAAGVSPAHAGIDRSSCAAAPRFARFPRPRGDRPHRWE